MLHSVKKKGFTLIELLIVIVVIGILAAGIMIAASEMEASSKAAKIINDLKQLETAAMSWYWDNYGTLKWSGKDENDAGDGYTIGGIKQESLHKLVQTDNTIITKYLGNANFSLNEGNDKYTSESANGLYAKLGGYSVYVGNGNKELYVFYRLSNDSNKKDNARLREKLKGRAKSANLVTYITTNDTNLKTKSKVYDGENIVGKLVMVFGDGSTAFNN